MTEQSATGDTACRSRTSPTAGGRPLGNDQQHNVWRASVAYVTGAHSLKVGYQAAYQVQKQFTNGNPNMISYTFHDGAPFSITQCIPSQQSNRTRFDAFYAQDQWTLSRLTLQGALRYEHAWSWFPEGRTARSTARGSCRSGFIFPRVGGRHRLPRHHAAHGRGLRRLRQRQDGAEGELQQVPAAGEQRGQLHPDQPGVTLQTTTDRTWTDNGATAASLATTRRSAMLASSLANGECGAWKNRNFGNPFSTTRVNPEIMCGWGVRPYDWQFGVAVQQEMLPRVSVDVSYNRRWWGNFFVTDNLALGAAGLRSVHDHRAARQPDLDGSGQPVTFLTRNARSRARRDRQLPHVRQRLRRRHLLLARRRLHGQRADDQRPELQGGFSTGGGMRDLCEIWAALPELVGTAQTSACRVEETWLTSWRGLVTYTIPKVDVLVSAHHAVAGQHGAADDGTAVASNGTSLTANYTSPTPSWPPTAGRRWRRARRRRSTSRCPDSSTARA